MNTTISRFTAALLVLATLPFFGANCRKGSTPCLFGGYSFAVTSEWNPQREAYSIGDTIILVSTFPKSLTDLVNPAININYSNSTGIGGNLTIFYLDSIQKQVVDAVNKFDFIPIQGKCKSSDLKPTRIKDLYYEETQTTYNLTVKVVLKSKGIFALYISNLLSRGINGQNCTNAGFSNILTNTNKNLNLFQNAMNRQPASQYEIDRLFCFRVQ